MRTFFHLGLALTGSAALWTLTGCSGAYDSSPAGLTPKASTRSAAAVHHTAGVRGFFSQAALAPGGAMAFVSDSNHEVVYIVSAQGATTAVLTGFATPAGMSVDQRGNLYVANGIASNVLDLAPPYNGTPAVISDPGQNPTMVAVDGNGNLAVTSTYNTSQAYGDIALYKAGSNTPTRTIQPHFYPQFCAFDAKGNLYVDGYGLDTFVGEVVGGVTGTSLTPLTTSNTIGFPGGVQVTKTGDIAIEDQLFAAIYTYRSPSNHSPANGSLGSPLSTTPLTNASSPITFALSASNAVVAVTTGNQVSKYAYPAGGSPLGATHFPAGAQPYGVAINPTAQYARY